MSMLKQNMLKSPSHPDHMRAYVMSTFYCHAHFYLSHTLHPFKRSKFMPRGVKTFMQPNFTLENMLEARTITLLDGKQLHTTHARKNKLKGSAQLQRC